ncbi:hypothetical protein Pint_00659 [Pistacia integerrima]|uniref:Uncharacterized protein n=1 Tax=Pistacia integerrima TaxID=434235 RepID=A0ACC0ZHZ5_9ROSI|nr:hypothetical protein Pint_00659 [Pistacia integerrima]
MFPDRSVCKAANVSYPTSEQELISAVSMATIAKRKMEVATRFSHSIPKLVCPDGEDGLLISTKYLNKILRVDAQAMTMPVESWVTLRQKIEEATKAELALPYTPYWWGLTIGGLMGTGAHGSTLYGNGSSVHDYVVELRIVSAGGAEDGYAKVRMLNETHQDLHAAKVSLEENQESTNDATGKCNGAMLVASTLMNTAFGLTNNGILLTGYPVIRFQNRLQSSGTCLYSPQDKLIRACSWDSRIKGEFFHQTTFTIGLSVVKNFIEDVQKLVALEPKSLCGLGLYNGILMRYVKASSAYLGKQEDSIDFDIAYYRSKDPMTPRL